MADAWQCWGQHLQGLLVQADEELKARSPQELQDEPDGAKRTRPHTKQRSVRAGRGAPGEPFLDMLAPHFNHQQETRNDG